MSVYIETNMPVYIGEKVSVYIGKSVGICLYRVFLLRWNTFNYTKLTERLLSLLCITEGIKSKVVRIENTAVKPV